MVCLSPLLGEMDGTDGWMDGLLMAAGCGILLQAAVYSSLTGSIILYLYLCVWGGGGGGSCTLGMSEFANELMN